MISFKSNYIDSAKVKRINASGVTDKQVSFVEINPSDYNDQLSINKTAIRWDNKGGIGFAYDICNSLNRFNEPDFKNHEDRFFALTTQKEQFENLNPKQILALTQVIKFDDDTQYVAYLQVDPKNSNKNRKAELRGCGRAMLDSLKKLFSTKNIQLDSVKNAINFYIKNGFESVGKNQDGESRMVWRNVSKSLH